MKYLLAGLNMVRTQKRLWPFVWKPLMLGVAAYFAILIGGYFLVVPRLSDWLSHWDWVNQNVASGVLTVLYGVLWFFISGPIFVGVVGAFSGFLWDRLAKEVELIHTGAVHSVDPKGAMPIVDTCVRLLMALVMAVLILFFGAWVFGLVGILLAGWQGTMEFSGAAFARQGIFFFPQIGRIWKAKGTFTFMIGAGVLSVIPIVNAFLFPGLVAGGTLLCLDAVQKEGHSTPIEKA